MKIICVLEYISVIFLKTKLGSFKHTDKAKSKVFPMLN